MFTWPSTLPLTWVALFALWSKPLGLIFGPTSAYFFQYNLIAAKKSLGTFSVFVCAILIFCNILRIYFWYRSLCAISLLTSRFGKRYDFALLLQSIVMITVQVHKFVYNFLMLFSYFYWRNASDSSLTGLFRFKNSNLKTVFVFSFFSL